MKTVNYFTVLKVTTLVIVQTLKETIFERTSANPQMNLVMKIAVTLWYAARGTSRDPTEDKKIPNPYIQEQDFGYLSDRIPAGTWRSTKP